jgi:hypothetical protein
MLTLSWRTREVRSRSRSQEVRELREQQVVFSLMNLFGNGRIPPASEMELVKDTLCVLLFNLPK